jgi:hypothetical protein
MSPTARKSVSCTYLIASHTQPDGVGRLAMTLARESPTSFVFVHHDAKAGALPAGVFRGQSNVAVEEDPIAASWGTFSLVELVLRSLARIRLSRGLDDWTVFISGQHYPARPPLELEAALGASGADAIMQFEALTPRDRHLKDRYGFHYRRVLEGPLPRVLRVKQLYDTIFNRFQPLARVQTDARGTFVGWRSSRSVCGRGIPVYKGSQWWALSRRAVETVLESIEREPRWVECFSRALIPDEAFFQTFFLNAAGIQVENALLHYEDWPNGSSSPRMLTPNDLPAIRASRRWFARKIDAGEPLLLDALDALRKDAALLQAPQ